MSTNIQDDVLEERCLFPKEEWDELIEWHPVSNIPVEEIYKDLPEVKEWHDAYCDMWLKKSLDR